MLFHKNAEIKPLVHKLVLIGLEKLYFSEIKWIGGKRQPAVLVKGKRKKSFFPERFVVCFEFQHALRGCVFESSLKMRADKILFNWVDSLSKN